jgi:hypothetical protein
VRFFQFFLGVTAKKAAASWCRRLPPHFGHLTLSCSYSKRVRRIRIRFRAAAVFLTIRPLIADGLRNETGPYQYSFGCVNSPLQSSAS